ncbi:MAG: hypothetical protein AAGA80_19070 [Cyanobacteria bacterium P01_F01_bin.143]
MFYPYSGPFPIPLVVIGSYRLNTGFTRVLEAILGNLGERYDIHYIGMGYKGEQRKIGNATLYPCNLKGGDVFGAYQGRDRIKQIKAPLVFLLNDLWMLKNYVKPLKSCRDQTKMVIYCPLDGKLTDDSLVAPFETVDRFVVYNSFAKAEIAKSVERLTQKGKNFAFSEIDIIPHGVDIEAFYPLAGSIAQQLEPRGRINAKKRLLAAHQCDLEDLDSSFIVLNANRPVPRKRIDLTIQGFALFAKDKPENVKLCLHHAVMNQDEREEILTLVGDYGICDRLILSPSCDRAEPISDKELNWVYNACDVGLNTAMGEGWGLVSFEHAATGAAQILPASSAGADLWQGAAELLEPINWGIPKFSLLEMAEVSIEGVARSLDKLYQNQDYRQTMSLAAYNQAKQPQYDWAAIAGQWDHLFRSTLEIV